MRSRCSCVAAWATNSCAPLRYRLAPQLRQWRVVIGAEEKPLALLVLLQKLVGQLVIVFAGSVRFSICRLSGLL